METLEELENKWIVWTETHDGRVTGEVKKSRLAAKRAYNKIKGDYKTYGWAWANSAEPLVRKSVGLSAFPTIRLPWA